MMIPKLIISSILFLTCNITFCQTTRFKGQLVQDTKIVKNYTLNVDGKPATTDDAGIFYVPIASSVKQVLVQPADQKYIILYPIGGRVLIPKDPSLITQIVVANFKSNNYIKSYLNVSKQIQDSIGKSQLQIKSLHLQLDSIVKVLHKLSYTDADLRSAKEIQEGKDRNLFDITKDLQDYSRNAQNLLSAFKYLSDYAFSNSRGLAMLSEAITSYNQSYDRLDGKRIFYQKVVNDYWGSEQAASLKNVMDFALDTVHTNKIYPLRDLLQQIREYFTSPKKDNQLKVAIQNKIANVIAEDADLIERLKNEITQFSQLLTT
ncbi:MAG TPA: hypothetical protein VLM16_08125 [Ginsengibacter sp.]|nr:hypothetical protein [Ginsengibacter sp.]